MKLWLDRAFLEFRKILEYLDFVNHTIYNLKYVSGGEA